MLNIKLIFLNKNQIMIKKHKIKKKFLPYFSPNSLF